MTAPADRRQEARARADPARRHRPARRHAVGRAVRARRPRRPLPRSQDAGRRRVLLQDAARHARARRDRARPDARDRALGGRRGRAAEGDAAALDPLRVPGGVPRGHRRVPRERIPTCRSTRRRSTGSSTSTATSCPASATRATGSSGPSDDEPAVRRDPPQPLLWLLVFVPVLFVAAKLGPTRTRCCSCCRCSRSCRWRRCSATPPNRSPPRPATPSAACSTRRSAT